jgi:hypothetical protein
MGRLKTYAQAQMGLETNFDNASATKQVIMSDDRDFSRPKDEFFSSITPSNCGDMSFAADGDDTIKQFQSYFGLDPTGVVDDKLIAAAKNVEDKIANVTNNPNVKGLLWSDSNKKFNTTLNDVQQALAKLQQLKAISVENKNAQ